jgi:Outer membrane protein beta-barrel domain
MRKNASIAALGAALTLAPAALGQQATNHAEGTHFGLGAGFNLNSITVAGQQILGGPFGGGSIVFPIDLAGVFRLEPELGLSHVSTADDDDDSRTETSATVVRPAIGAFFRFPLGPTASGYVGGRLGPQFASSSTTQTVFDTNQEITVDASRVDFAIGPAFGGEYFFSKHFSIGGEVALNFVFVGNESQEVTPGPTPADNDDSGVIAGTNTLLFVRTFFF